MANKKTKGVDAGVAKTLKRFEEKQNVVDHRIQVRTRDNRLAIIVTAAVFVVSLFGQYAYFNFGPGISPAACIHFVQTKNPVEPGKPANLGQIPDAKISECRDWTGTLTINNAKMDIKLYGNAAPQAVGNFISLTRDGFYNSVPCHRLVTAGIYVLQCGDPYGTGAGGPGYHFGPIENAPVAASKTAAPTYKKGWLAMARSSNTADSMGSQFFVVYKDSQIPNDTVGGYTVFGEITSGLDGLNPIINAGVKGGKTDGSPVVKTSITSITIKK